MISTATTLAEAKKDIQFSFANHKIIENIIEKENLFLAALDELILVDDALDATPEEMSAFFVAHHPWFDTAERALKKYSGMYNRI